VAQVIVRNLDEDVKLRLKKRAARHGRSMEEEIRQILQIALRDDNSRPVRLGSRIAGRFAGSGLPNDLPELQGQTMVPMDLDA